MKRAKKSCKKEVLLLMHFLIGMPAAALSRHCAFLRAPLKVKPFSMFFRLMTHSQIIDFSRLVVCPGKIFKFVDYESAHSKNNNQLSFFITDCRIFNMFSSTNLHILHDFFTFTATMKHTLIINSNSKNIEALQMLLKTLPGK